jgi:hypothetical protein
MRGFDYIEKLLGRKRAPARVSPLLSEAMPKDTSTLVLDTKNEVGTSLDDPSPNVPITKENSSGFSVSSLASAWTKPPSTIEEEVKNKTDKILFNDDTSVLNELMKQIMISNETRGEVVNSRSDVSRE